MYYGIPHPFLNRNPGGVFGDNGTNFVGAKSELEDCPLKMKKQKSSKNCFWRVHWFLNHLIHSHFGGAWEASRRSTSPAGSHSTDVYGSKTSPTFCYKYFSIQTTKSPQPLRCVSRPLGRGYSLSSAARNRKSWNDVRWRNLQLNPLQNRRTHRRVWWFPLLVYGLPSPEGCLPSIGSSWLPQQSQSEHRWRYTLKNREPRKI